MRTLRLILWFCVGLLLGGVTVLAHAESIPATTGYTYLPATVVWRIASGTPKNGSTPEAACTAWIAANQGYTYNATWTGTIAEGRCVLSNTYYNPAINPYTVTCPTGYTAISNGTADNGLPIKECKSNTQGLTCPQTGGWTLSGTTCTRPDPCPSAGTATGKLSPTTTPSTHPDLVNSYAWNDPTITQKQYAGGGTFCSGGCQVAYQSSLCITPVPGNYNCAVLNTSYTGATCTGTTTPMVVGGATADTPKTPPCDPGQSIIQMGGKLACLPSGMSPDTPKQTTTSSTQNFPDGSTKITNTTQTCNGAGACSSTTTITNTPATSGPNAGGAGQAGNPGTTTEEQEESGDTSDFCAKNPNLQVCKGGIAEEGTQKLVLDEIKKISTAPENSEFVKSDDYDGVGGAILEGADPDAVASVLQVKEDQTNLMKGHINTDTGEVKADPEMVSLLAGWFEDVPRGTCETPSFTVAGHSIEFENWCPTADKIASIGAYALWFLTLIGLFNMVTGGKEGAT